MLSSGQDFDKNFLDSKQVLKVYFKPSRKNQDFLFSPLPLLPVFLAHGHLNYIGTHYIVQNISLFNFLFRNSGRQLVAPTEPETFPFRTVQNQRTIDDNVIEDSIDNRHGPMNLRTVTEALHSG